MFKVCTLLTISTVFSGSGGGSGGNEYCEAIYDAAENCDNAAIEKALGDDPFKANKECDVEKMDKVFDCEKKRRK